MTELPELKPIDEAKIAKKSKIHTIVNFGVVFAISVGMVYTVKGFAERYVDYDSAYQSVRNSIQKKQKLKNTIIELDKDLQKSCNDPSDFRVGQPARTIKISYCLSRLRFMYATILDNESESDETILNVSYIWEDRIDYLILQPIAIDETYNYIVSKSSIKNRKFDPTVFLRIKDPEGVKYGAYLTNELKIAQKELIAIDPENVKTPEILKK